MKDQKRGGDSTERSKNSDQRDQYDPYEQDPGAGKQDDERVNEADEREARQREGVHLASTDRLDDSTTAPLIHTGITGQTTRGSYGFNDATGQGAYMDRTRDGSADVAADPIEQPADRFGSNDDPVDGSDQEGEEIGS